MLGGARMAKGDGPKQELDRGRPAASPAPAGVTRAAALQQSIGNRALVALLAAGQAKLRVGAADDRYEREADAVASDVLSRLRSGTADHGHAGHGHTGDGHAGHRIEEDEAAPLGRVLSRLQRAAREPIGPEGGDLDTGTESDITAARSGGSALPGGIRTSMEGAFGADFSSVKVHRGDRSEALNDAVGARAFTIGSDIFLGRSSPDLQSGSGQSLIAHELAHTIQQGAAKVDER